MLEVSGLHAGYDVTEVLHDVSLTIGSGEVLAICGPNGAGKTTFLKVVSGLLRPTRGRVTWEEQNLLKMSAVEIVRSGVAHCPEGRRVFPRMSTEANLLLGAYTRKDRAAVKVEVAEFLSLWPVLGARRHSAAGTLSGGEQQILAIGRALMSRPRLLLLDEPSLGLAPVLIAQVYEGLKQLLAERELAVLLVEQNVSQALALASRVCVLAGGKVMFSAGTKDTSADEIGSHYFGTSSLSSSTSRSSSEFPSLNTIGTV